MNFQEMKEGFVKKLGQENFDGKAKEFTEDAKDYGYSEQDMNDYLARRFVAYLSKAMAGGGNKLERIETEVIFIAKQENDFGKRWQYKNAKQKAEEDFDRTLRAGLIDSEGNPLCQNRGSDNGKPIDPNNYNVEYYGIANVEGAWKKCMLTHDSGMAVAPFELFRTLKGTFGMRKPVKQLDNVDVSLGPVSDGIITAGDRLDAKSIKSLIDNYFADYVVDVKSLIDKDIQDFRDEKKAKGWNRFSIVMGDTSDGVESKENGATWMKLSVPLSEVDIEGGNYSSPLVQCWINDAGAEMNIKAGAIDVIVTGRFKLEKNDFGKQFSMSDTSIYVDDKFILKPEERAETITPTNGKEESSEPEKDFSGVQIKQSEEKPDEKQFA